VVKTELLGGKSIDLHWIRWINEYFANNLISERCKFRISAYTVNTGKSY